jgi:hypothetical protein
MSLSYSALTNHGKITLPSVDTWGTNMSILRDPPASIQTRRIDKVGQTSSITEMVDESGDRACEAILQYSRGINPFVSVEYNNTSSMNGNPTNKSFNGANNQQAFLPYRVARDGAFRPPIQTEYNLLPLSRLPRVWTSNYTNPQFIDFSKQMIMQGNAETTKEVKNSILKASARPTAVYKIETPQEKPYTVKYNIQDNIKISASAGMKTSDRTMQHVGDPTKEINRNLNHAFAQSNVKDIKYINNNEFNPERFIQDTNAHSVDTIKGANHIQIGTLEDYIDMGDVRTKDAMNIDYTTAMKGQEKTDYIHDDLEFDRNLPVYSADSNIRGNQTKIDYIHNDIEFDRNVPVYSADSNKQGQTTKISYLHDDLELSRNIPEYNVDSNVKMEGGKMNYIHDDISLNRVLPEHTANTSRTQNIQKMIKPEYVRQLNHPTPQVQNMVTNKYGQGESNISSRRVNLAEKIQPGSFHVAGSIPNRNRASNVKQNFESEKAKMSKMVMDQHIGRFETYAPFDKRFKQ